MSGLPKIDSPIYELVLPLSEKKIKFRPFLVKEQRNLMMAMESDDKNTIEQNINQVLHNCSLSDIEIESLPILDVEFYFLNLRARSVGEIVENRYQCKNQTAEITKTFDDDGVPICGNVMNTSFNLLDIKVEKNPNIKNVIQLTENVSIKLKYPQFSVLERAKLFDNATDMAFDMIVDCVEYIFDGTQYHYAKETSPKEILEFIERLNHQQFEKIEEFFNEQPIMSKKIDMKCSKCGFDHTIEVEGLENFFG